MTTIPAPADYDWDLMEWMAGCAEADALAVVVPAVVKGQTTVGWQTFTYKGGDWTDAEPRDYVRAATRARTSVDLMVKEAEDAGGG